MNRVLLVIGAFMLFLLAGNVFFPPPEPDPAGYFVLSVLALAPFLGIAYNLLGEDDVEAS